MTNFESTRNVLVAVDVQNDFIDGSLAVAESEQVVEPINSVASAVRQANGAVVFTRDWHPASTPHFDSWPVHCVAETEGAAFHPELQVTPNDTIISKGMGQTDGYSGWEGVNTDNATLETIVTPQTALERVRVFVGGLATDYCVKATALDLARAFSDDERVDLYLLRDAIRAVNLELDDERKALEAITQARVIAISSQEATALIKEMVR